jgi:ribonuclease P protein component
MKRNEKNISAKQCAQETHTRISDTDEHDGRTRDNQTAPSQGQKTLDRLNSAETGAPINSQGRPFSFPKSVRLLARREFLFLQSRGKRRHCPHFVLLLSPAKDGRSRLGITVTRRFGNAVQRNRMKRMLREFFRASKEKITPAQDVLIIPRAGSYRLTLDQVARELGKALSFAEYVS